MVIRKSKTLVKSAKAPAKGTTKVEDAHDVSKHKDHKDHEHRSPALVKTSAQTTAQTATHPEPSEKGQEKSHAQAPTSTPAPSVVHESEHSHDYSHEHSPEHSHEHSHDHTLANQDDHLQEKDPHAQVKSTSKPTAKSLKSLKNADKPPTSDKAKKALEALEALIALKDPAAESLETPAKAVTTPKIDSKLESNLAQQPPRAINSPIRIFQIYFEAWQRELLDPAFYPLDNSRGTSELMEFAVFEQLQKNPATQGSELWGAMSWRFGEKTGMIGSDWVKQITDNPGYDVYFCNPYPANEAVYHNMWLQGEVSHPSFIEVCKAFFVAAGLDDKELNAIHPSTSFSAANYFVATPKFWDIFIPFVKRVLVTADKKMPPAIRDVLHSKVADDKGLHAGATYVPFIVERLFPYFMHTEGKELKGFKISLPERERELNVHLKLLREMKDVAHRTQSAWLAACWVNYRNLYLSQTNSKAWCEKYLRPITPTEVRFL